MAYHVYEENINHVSRDSAIKVCDEGIIGTFEQAKKEVLDIVEEKQRLLVQVKYYIEHDIKKEFLEICRCECEL